jgi:hypothetical protein
MTMMQGGLSPDDRSIPTIRRGSAANKRPPCFLAQALGWVEFRRIVLQRQWQYSPDNSQEGVSGSLPGEQLGLMP